MAIIRNLATVPAVKVDTATWFGPVGWARTAAAHASLPRTTAFTGTTAGDLALGRADAVPGRYYVVSLSVRAVAPQLASLNIDWYGAGNAYLSTTSGAGSDHGTINMTAGSTQRFAVIGLAPALTVRVTAVPAGLDAGGAQITALMIREFASLVDAQAAVLLDRLAANYVDGDTPGATWDGTNGGSTSRITRDEPAAGAAAMGPLNASGLGVRTSFGAGEALFAPLLASTGLFATATYDRRRGRIRVSVSGLAASVVRIIVWSRPAGGTGRWIPVRGGRVSVTAGAPARPVDDYEYRAGGGMTYRVDALTTLELQPPNIVQVAYATADDTEDQAWLKFIPTPATNLPIDLVVDDWGLTHDPRSELHHVPGRADPIVVTDLHTSATTTIRIRTRTDDERDALRRALTQGSPAFLQVPDSVPLPSMYVSIGRVRAERWGGRTSRRYLLSVDVTEVSAPPPSVVGAGVTWASTLDRYATWEEVLADSATWLELMS